MVSAPFKALHRLQKIKTSRFLHHPRRKVFLKNTFRSYYTEYNRQYLSFRKISPILPVTSCPFHTYHTVYQESKRRFIMPENYNEFFQNSPSQEQINIRPWGCPPCPPCNCRRDRWDNQWDNRWDQNRRNNNWPWR